jgi:TrmH family RNA methyltransferase
MLSRSEIKYIQSLCQKKQRQEEGLFIAEGPKIASEILQSDFVIQKIYALPEWVAANKHEDVDIIEIDAIELSRISALQTPNQVVVVAAQKNDFGKPVLKGQISLVLDGIQDPGNMGTIIRIADWFGVQQIICSEDTVELYNPKVIQSTMGSFVRTRIFYTNLADFFKTADVPVFGAVLNGKNIYELQKPKEGLLLFGNEGKGIRNELLSCITQPITIPKKGGAESLNAAVATGIILSHLL